MWQLPKEESTKRYELYGMLFVEREVTILN
jgi:hypothetical protein